MTEPLYLIAHKVRGTAAFDIAIKMLVSDEEWWIIPTSGHRAYPFWNCQLSWFMTRGYTLESIAEGIPPDTRDHYSASVRHNPPTHKLTPSLDSILEMLR